MAYPQCMKSLWTFIITFCLCYFIETISFTYMVTAIQSIERQFQIPSRLSGALVSAQDIGYVSTVVFLAYFGSKGNRARWIGGGCFLIAVACFIVALPHFIFTNKFHTRNHTRLLLNYIKTDLSNQSVAGAISAAAAISPKIFKYATSPIGYCNPFGNALKIKLADLECLDEEPNTAAMSVVFIGIVLIGVGHSMPFSLGIPLIDDRVKKRSAPLYFGGLFFIRIFGPVLGFVLGGAMNKVYVTLNAPPGLSSQDPSWVGAWWLGFLVIAALLCGPSLFLFIFPALEEPKERPKATSSRTPSHLKAKEQSMTTPKRNPPPVTSASLKDFLLALRGIFKSPVYIGCLCGRLFDAFAFKGFFVFLPKYIENHFGMPLFRASMLLGIIGVVGFALGIVVGSGIMRRYKLDGRRAAVFVAVGSLVASSLSLIQLALGCHSPVNQIGRIGRPIEFNFTSTCNSDCACDPINLFPVCSRNGTPYFSACTAGCTNMTIRNLKTFDFRFSDCSCTDGEEVSREFCKDDCQLVTALFFAMMVITGIISGTTVIPGILIVLRCVKPELRSVALGVSAFIASLLSTFPSPIVYGFIIDTTCLKWSRTCTGSGACEIYDPELLRYRYYLFNSALRAAGSLFDIFVVYYAKNLRLLDDPIDENEISEAENDVALKKLSNSVDPVLV